MYKIKITKIAAANIQGIDKTAQIQIIKKIEKLRDEPELLGKQLKGPLKDYRSVRAAGQRYRVIYRIVEYEIIVIVVAVGNGKEEDKKDIYELMKKYIKTNLLG
jgi:mRNA interferase RelE/StbE